MDETERAIRKNLEEIIRIYQTTSSLAEDARKSMVELLDRYASVYEKSFFEGVNMETGEPEVRDE